MKKIYMDYSSATPMDKRVIKQMRPYFSREFGNAMSIHQLGLNAKKALDNARKNTARILGVKKEEIIFTGGGTESNNLAIFGIARKYKKEGGYNHIITSKIEHSSVLRPIKSLEKCGFNISRLSVTNTGKVLIEELEKALTKNTSLISIGYVNSEIGTIQNIHKISLFIKKYKKSIGRIDNEPPFLHTDAIQAQRFLNINMYGIGADSITLNASKMYGPKGVGVLCKKNNVEIEPQIFGGGQEYEIRSGTENIPAIVGFSTALSIVQKEKEKDYRDTKKLKDVFVSNIKRLAPEAIICGDIKNGAPHIVDVVVPNLSGEQIVIELDMRGIFVSSGSACTEKETNISHVIGALPDMKDLASSSVRFSFGRETKVRDVKKTAKYFSKIIKELKLRQSGILK